MLKVNTTLCVILIGLATAQSVTAQRPLPPPASPEKQAMINLGLEHETAWDLYQYFRQQANGGTALSWQSAPDWSGVWTREASPFFWDPDQASMEALPTAKLTPEYERRLLEKLDRVAQGIEYDPLSAGDPAGMPRWIVEPFLKEFAVTPQQTWLINEMQNEIRRVYTDGRGHPAPADAYPLYEGDSIGFWDGDRLVIHTNQMQAGQYQRIQPHHSEQVEVVEIWQKISADTIVADTWVYDPPALEEPWYTRQVLKKLTNDDGALRIRYWHFNENQNNTVIETQEGGSQFDDFTFTDADD